MICSIAILKSIIKYNTTQNTTCYCRPYIGLHNKYGVKNTNLQYLVTEKLKAKENIHLTLSFSWKSFTK
jgi:hypothetical protein